MIRAVRERLRPFCRPPTESLWLLRGKTPLIASQSRATFMSAFRAALTTAAVWVIGTIAAFAQAPAPLHDPQYPDADIAYGATLYASRCVTCHGPQGDGIGGVNLRTGAFKTAITDRDLDRVIRNGSPAGMPKFDLDAAEMAGVIAYIRNMNAIDASTSKATPTLQRPMMPHTAYSRSRVASSCSSTRAGRYA